MNYCIQNDPILGYSYAIFGGMGVTAGAHRLWAHRAYKANYKMRSILAIANLISFQNCIFHWVNKLHSNFEYTSKKNSSIEIMNMENLSRFVITDPDPHNSKRGFFFSHMGWLLVLKNPDVKTKGATIDMNDLRSDPIVMFQKKY